MSNRGIVYYVKMMKFEAQFCHLPVLAVGTALMIGCDILSQNGSYCFE